jgi:hypothetical protein
LTVGGGAASGNYFEILNAEGVGLGKGGSRHGEKAGQQGYRAYRSYPEEVEAHKFHENTPVGRDTGKDDTLPACRARIKSYFVEKLTRLLHRMRYFGEEAELLSSV